MADGIKIGNLDISAFKVGSSDCKVYLGNALLYPRSVETRVVAKYNVTDTSNPTQIINEYEESQFSEIEIDGVVQPSVVSAYTFNTTGEHTIKYTLTDPTSIGDEAFEECTSLTSIDIPDSVTSIGQYAFSSCSGLTSIEIPSGVTSIGASGFSACTNLTSIVIPDSVTSIGSYTFSNCSGLTSVTLSSGITNISQCMFYQCRNLRNINIPNSVNRINPSSFVGCSSLTSINIPDNVTGIGQSAFDGCNKITSMTIGSGLTSMGPYVFYGCSRLTSIQCNAMTAPWVYSSTFSGIASNGTLRVPNGSTGYDTWMGTGDYYLGKYNWTKVEQ